MNKKIIVSMTSWLKRIDNCKMVIESLLNQEMKADFIELNLSLEEFPNKEMDLPQDLIELIYENNPLEINWVEGNDGVFKKIIPTLKKFYGKEYYLLSVDDDWLYRSDYIKLMVEYIEKYNGDAFCLFRPLVIGNRMIYKSSCFKSDFWEKLTPEVISSRIDDAYIEHYLHSYNKKISGFRPNDTPDITKRYNQIFPNSHNTETGEYTVKDINKAKEVISKIKFNKDV
jgi:hypothetical protein